MNFNKWDLFLLRHKSSYACPAAAGALAQPGDQFIAQPKAQCRDRGRHGKLLENTDLQEGYQVDE